MDQNTELALDGLMPTRTLLGLDRGDDGCPATRLLTPAIDAGGPVAAALAAALAAPVGGVAVVPRASHGRGTDETVEPWPPPTPPAVRAYGRRGASPAHLPLHPSRTPGVGVPAYAPPSAASHVSGGAWIAQRGGRATGTHVVISRRKVEETVALVAVAAAVVLSLVAAGLTG